jgi:hypothetical protein
MEILILGVLSTILRTFSILTRFPLFLLFFFFSSINLSCVARYLLFPFLDQNLNILSPEDDILRLFLPITNTIKIII